MIVGTPTNTLKSKTNKSIGPFLKRIGFYVLINLKVEINSESISRNTNKKFIIDYTNLKLSM